MSWDVWAPVAASAVAGGLAVWGVSLAAKREAASDILLRNHTRTETRRAERKDTYRAFLHAAGAFTIASRQVSQQLPGPGGEPPPLLELPRLYQALAIAASEVMIATTNVDTRQAVSTYMDTCADLVRAQFQSPQPDDAADAVGFAMGEAMASVRDAMASELDV